MPLIPLPRISATPDAPAPVLDNQRRPTLDNSAVIQGVDELARAQRKPELPGEALSAPFRALGAVGEAIARTGSVIGAAALKEQEARKVHQIGDGEAAMSAADEELRGILSTVPETQWTKTAAEFRKKTADAILANNDLNGDARQELGLRTNRWQLVGAKTVEANARMRTYKKAADTITGNIETAIEAQDFPRMDAAFKEGDTLGIWSGGPEGFEREAYNSKFAEVGKRKEREAKAESYNTAQNTAITMTKAKGEKMAVEDLENGLYDPPGRKLDAADRARLRNSIQAVARDETQAAVDSLVDGIATGSFNSEAAIDAATADNPHIAPRVIQQLKRDIHERDVYKERLDRDQNWQANAQDLLPRIRAYDPSKDPDRVEYLKLQSEQLKRVGVMDGGYLDGILRGKLGTLKPDKTVAGYVRESIRQMFDPRDGAAPYMEKVWVPKNPDTRVLGLTLPASEWKVEEKPNRQREKEATRAEWEMYQKMGTWLKSNPSATIEQAEQAMRRFIPSAYKAASLNLMQQRFQLASQPAQRPAAARSSRTEPDLPPLVIDDPLQLGPDDELDGVLPQPGAIRRR